MKELQDRLRDKLQYAVLNDAVIARGHTDRGACGHRERVLSHSARREVLRTVPSVKVLVTSRAHVRSWTATVLCAALPVLPIHDDVLVQVRGFKKRSHLFWCASIVTLMADQNFALFPRQLIWWSQPLANSQLNPLLLCFGHPDLAQLCTSDNI